MRTMNVTGGTSFYATVTFHGTRPALPRSGKTYAPNFDGPPIKQPAASSDRPRRGNRLH